MYDARTVNPHPTVANPNKAYLVAVLEDYDMTTGFSLIIMSHLCVPRICDNNNNKNRNKAYRPNAHLLYIVMHYNGNII